MIKIKFCIATIIYWNSLGFDCTNWRKSEDGLYAIVHYEYVKHLNNNVDSDMNIKIIMYNTEELTQALLIGWGNEALTLDNFKKQQIDKISKICNNVILNGFESSAKNETLRHYDFSYEDQINLIGIQNKIMKEQLLQGGVATSIEWKNSEQVECEVWTLTEFLQLCDDAELFKTTNVRKCHKLISDIENAVTREEVEVILW